MRAFGHRRRRGRLPVMMALEAIAFGMSIRGTQLAACRTGNSEQQRGGCVHGSLDEIGDNPGIDAPEEGRARAGPYFRGAARGGAARRYPPKGADTAPSR